MSPDEAGFSSRAEAFILAGGQSRRMGSDKARLAWNGRPLVRVLYETVAPCVAHVWLVCKPDSGYEDLGLPLLYDRAPGYALVHGLHAALHAPGPPWRFVLGCDMPGVDRDVLEALWRTAAAKGAPGSYPRRPATGAVEPLPSLWRTDVAARVDASWGLAARDWVARAGLAAWDVPAPAEPSLVNVNTPGDWEDWRCRERDAR